MSGPPAPRIALIHALPESLAPLNAELDLAWPDCVRMHLLDDSLSADVARAPHGLDESFDQRFLLLAEYAVTTGVDGILFSCSAFGRCIEEVARWLAPLPVLKPNEAMIDDALATGRRIGLVATFAPTLTSMAPEFPEGPTSARRSPPVGSTHCVPATSSGTMRSSPRRRHDWSTTGAGSSPWRSSAWRARPPWSPNAPGCPCSPRWGVPCAD